jgi:serine/threonine-protein kinase
MTSHAIEHRSTDRLVGQLLASRYQIEHKLGEGAMGAVYRARHVKFGRPFAVKVLHPKLLEDKKVALRFEREAELAGRLHHPNVIGVVDVGETADGMRYMVMDFAEGSDLAGVLIEAPMPPERIIPLVRQMLEGLYHAHEAGLIHRDFKPENVIVERNDHGAEVPRIVDFGISILREGGDSTDANGRLTTNGLVLGTPHYMAPEQAVADPIDHRIDLFAMGIVVYEMLCGKLPFDGAGAEVARANLLLDPPPISQRVPHLEVDPLLEAFARRLMAKRRDHRPATAKHARELLDLIERDRPAAAAALGVPHEASSRTPQVTQPVAPQAVEPQPPVARATLETAPAQRAAALADLPPREPTGELPHSRASAPMTSAAEPLPWGDRARSPRRRRLIGGGLGLAAAGAILAVAMGASGGGGATTPGGPQLSPSAAPEPAPPSQPPEAAGGAVAPAVAEPPLPGPATAADPPPADPDPGSAEPGPDTAKPAPDATRRRPTRARRPDRSAIQPSPPASTPPASTPPASAPPASAPAVAATRPDAARSPAPAIDPASSSEAIQREWQAVLGQINALKKTRPDSAARLRARWQLIKINDAMRLEGVRRKAAAELAEIRKLIAAERP